MGFTMHAHQMRLVDIGVALRCRQAGMAEKFLDRPEVGAIAKKMRGEGMAKRVRSHMRRQVQFQTQRLDKSLRGARAIGVATGADKQRA